MSRAYQEKTHLVGGELIRQIALGMNDGVVSIFALLAGIAGAGQESQTILITLLAATVAGAVSMAAGEFISSKNENAFYENEINKEKIELKLVPEIERKEIRLIYQKKGLSGSELDKVVTQITSNPELWLRELVTEELGITEANKSNLWKNTLVIFGAFCLGASFSVIPYLFYRVIPSNILFIVATIITLGGLFIVGALKKFITGQFWLKSALEMLLVGVFTFIVTYLIGMAVGVAV
jgi:VIT1/CCC1 family predicted Fe2+/Mn2+ transporter